MVVRVSNQLVTCFLVLDHTIFFRRLPKMTLLVFVKMEGSCICSIGFSDLSIKEAKISHSSLANFSTFM